jgi:hypothetical protein
MSEVKKPEPQPQPKPIIVDISSTVKGKGGIK